MSAIIPLTKGLVALIDDEDYERVSQYNWFSDVRTNGIVYARTHPKTVVPKNYTTILLHRFVMDCVGDRGVMIDHINRDGLDCRKANLRKCSASQNMCNKIANVNKGCPYKGVCFVKDRGWRASVKINRKVTFGGYHKTAVEAAVAYNKLALQLHGEFARLNVIPNEVQIA